MQKSVENLSYAKDVHIPYRTVGRRSQVHGMSLLNRT